MFMTARPRRGIAALFAAASLSVLLSTSVLASEARPRIELPPQSYAFPDMLVSPDDPGPTATAFGAGRRIPRVNLTDPRDGILRGAPSQDHPAVDRALLERVLGGPIPEVGGDDVAIGPTPTSLASEDMAIASNGDIYVALGFYQGSPDYDEWIEVYRSKDGGTTFQLFGSIHTMGDTDGQRLTRMIIAEGNQDRLFVQYMYFENSGIQRFRIECAYTSMTGPTAVWNTRVVFNESGVSHLGGDIVSDAVNYPGYYLYAVTAGLDGNGDDIWFSRSTDFGNTWSAPYKIASISSSGNLMYSRPHIDYGFGGALHVAWTYTERLQSTFDDAVYYRRALNFADAGIADWDGVLWQLRPTNDGVDQNVLDVAASTNGNEVVVLHTEGPFHADPHIFYSTDVGASWSLANRADLPWDLSGTVAYRPSTSEFVAAGSSVGGEDHVVFSAAPAADLTAWSPPQRFSDEVHTGYGIYTPPIAFDPTHGDRVGILWDQDYGDDFFFDAEWRADPGYPNLEDGFPVALDIGSGSPPAVVNIDQDPYLEIVFADHNGNVQVYKHDGTPAPGWPRYVGAMPLRAPVAVGDLAGHHYPTIVAGTSDGHVVAMAPDGSPAPGFPVDLGTGAATYVSIGALRNNGEREIVACSGTKMFTLDGRGELGPIIWLFSAPMVAPAAIGDVDDDGQVEIVSVKGPDPVSGWYFVNINDPNVYAQEGFRALPANVISGAATLADIDLDGDLEIAVPTAEGQLFMLQHTGVDVAGWPWSNGTGLPLTSAAMAQFIGTSTPDVAVASQDWRVHVLYADGTQQSNYPQNTGSGWWLYGAPIVDCTHRTSSNVIIGSRDQMAWSFDNVGGIAPGWPKGLGGLCEVSPASGDIDLDGNNEVVFLTSTDLIVVDVGYPPQATARYRWPMFGYDAQRRGCLDCDDAILDDVQQVGAPSRVAFSVNGPNPTRGAIEFRFGLPRDAAVELDVFDVHGRRVRNVLKREQAAGEYVAGFDGRDRTGQALADGMYFARLLVRGPGGNRAETRRFTVLH
jgi:FlgD Ig-like domain